MANSYVQAPFNDLVRIPYPVRSGHDLLVARSITLPDTSFVNLAPDRTADEASLTLSSIYRGVLIRVLVTADCVLRVRWRIEAGQLGWTSTDWILSHYESLPFQAVTLPAIDSGFNAVAHERMIEVPGADELNLNIRALSSTNQIVHAMLWGVYE